MLAASPVRDIATGCLSPDSSFWAFAHHAANTEGTPLYVYVPQLAHAAWERLVDGTGVWGRCHVAFSVKTNPLFELLHDLAQWGSFAEVVSAWEFSQALAAGFQPERVIINGPLKAEQELRRIVRSFPLTVNMDSLDEFELIERAAVDSGSRVRVGLRICPPRYNGTWSRFGLELATGEVKEAIGRIRMSSRLELRCIHFHLGTQLPDYRRHLEMIKVVRELWIEHGLGDEVCLDIGGGFPYEHEKPFERQTFRASAFFQALAEAWGPKPRPLLLLEPGRLISAPGMAIVSRVLACKARIEEPSIVVLDSGTNLNVMGAFYDHLWSYAEPSSSGPHRLCGPLCMEDDVLSGERGGPIPKVGSLVATFNAGAYSLALSRTFIQARPPILALASSGQYQRLRAREEADNVYALRPPDHLIGGSGIEGGR